MCINPYTKDALLSKIKTHDIISFDIFDTLVMRNVYINKDVFRLLSKRVEPGLREAFYNARVKAQSVLTEKEYPYIEAIYAEVSRLIPELKGREESLITDEIALERSLIIPRREMVEVFNLAKSLGKMVNIVSDMYFHQDTMKTILDDNGITGYDKILISSEYNTGKPQHLFEKYLEIIPSGRCLHIGDSWECDILPARRLGIDTFRLKMSTEIYEYEENTISPADLTQRTQIAEYVSDKYNDPFYRRI